MTAKTNSSIKERDDAPLVWFQQNLIPKKENGSISAWKFLQHIKVGLPIITFNFPSKVLIKRTWLWDKKVLLNKTIHFIERLSRKDAQSRKHCKLNHSLQSFNHIVNRFYYYLVLHNWLQWTTITTTRKLLKAECCIFTGDFITDLN